MRKLFIITSTLMLLVWVGIAPFAGAVEPNKIDYTSYPVFMANTITPNILIIMDNSGSMDEPAYLDDFQGVATGTCGATAAYTASSQDDAEENLGTHSMYTGYSDLWIGEYGSWKSEIGVRFRNVEVPQGAVITNAYITFTAYNDASAGNASFTIHGEDIGDASYFTTSSSNISNRNKTSASAAWNFSNGWSQGSTYDTADLAAIVQEIVNLGAWVGGESEMAFMLSGTGFRAARSYDYGDHTSGPVLHIEYDQDCSAMEDGQQYYGLFDAESKYSYDSGQAYFYRDSGGAWDGNWLNWLTMRKVDLAKKVIMGGQALDARNGDGTQILIGEETDDHSWEWQFDSTNVSPHGGTRWFGIYDGKIYVDGDSDPYSGTDYLYRIRVLKEESSEPGEFVDGDAGGVLQRIGDRARWGYASFDGDDGANIHYPVGADTDNIADYLQSESMNSWTPLAESLYVTLQYFKQEAVAGGLSLDSDAAGPLNDTWDPYNADGEVVWCAKSFVILLTDGASTQDLTIPSALKNLTDGHDTFITAATTFGSDGSDYLKDVAHYMRTNDLRNDIEGDQNVSLYTVYMFDNDPSARDLLKESARQGGFEDRNDNGWPDGLKSDPAADRKEWDENEDGDPDTYYEAHDGFVLQNQLISAINDILSRAASGTAASVLATNAEGEGNLVQAYFRPSKIEGTSEVRWLGYLQSLWVDPCGNLREDTNQNQRLDMNEDANQNGSEDYGEDINHNGLLDTDDDLIVKYYSDPLTSDTVIHRFTTHWIYDNPLDCEEYDATPSDYVYETIALESISPIWEVGKVLAERDPATRNIFTYIDKVLDRSVDEDGDVDPFDSEGELVTFDAASANRIKPYLGVMDNTAWSYLGAAHDTRVSNLIAYTRGTDFDGLRSRTIGGDVWKLGDIVHSTPVTVAKPVDNYHIIYGDESYQAYYDDNRDREAVVYVGANDGMLHAFTSYYYDPDLGEYVKPTGRGTIGEELWAYIPQALLPHLKWLPDQQYEHSYFVDFKPKIFDAKIGDPAVVGGDPTWRTVLVCGLNYGGKHIWAEGDFDDGGGTTTRHFYPSYTAMDITDPQNPVLLWERSYTNLAMTAATPAVIRVKEDENDEHGNWYVVFGSGPTDYDGTSNQNGYIFVVDLKTGIPADAARASDWQYDTGIPNSFMNTPSSLDYELTNNVDSIYFGDSAGNAWHISTHTGDPATPHWNPAFWDLYHLYEGDRPITASLGLSIDNSYNVWVYFGTGRYIADVDRITDDQEYLIGIRDPYYSGLTTMLPLSIADSDLFNSGLYNIYDNLYVDGGSADIESWYDLIDAVRNQDGDGVDYHGWYLNLESGTPSERIITKPAVLGGAVFVPAFTPNSDLCGYGGQSNFYAVYYETGTAYYKELLPGSASAATITDASGNTITVQKIDTKIHLGEGMPPPAVGVHTGRQKGATAFLQMSTGEVVEVDLDTPFNIKSGLMNWRQ